MTYKRRNIIFVQKSHMIDPGGSEFEIMVVDCSAIRLGMCGIGKTYGIKVNFIFSYI